MDKNCIVKYVIIHKLQNIFVKKHNGESMSVYNDDDNSMCRKFSNYEDDQEDCDFFKSLYPVELMEMQMCIEEKCNELEYPGSIMYDKYPDRVRVMKLAKDMCVKRTDYDDKMMQVMLVNEMLKRRMRRRA